MLQGISSITRWTKQGQDIIQRPDVISLYNIKRQGLIERIRWNHTTLIYIDHLNGGKEYLPRLLRCLAITHTLYIKLTRDNQIYHIKISKK